MGGSLPPGAMLRRVYSLASGAEGEEPTAASAWQRSNAIERLSSITSASGMNIDYVIINRVLVGFLDQILETGNNIQNGCFDIRVLFML
jgi:hypothetical protein